MEETTIENETVEDVLTTAQDYLDEVTDTISGYSDDITSTIEDNQDLIESIAVDADEYSTTTSSALFGAGLFAGGFFLVFFLVMLAVSAVCIVAKWKIFTKAEKPGWAALIPFYGNWVNYEILNMPWWLCLLSLIPYVGAIAVVVFSIIANIRLAKAFGKEPAFSIGLILLPIIFLPILAFGDATYLGKETAGKELFKQN